MARDKFPVVVHVLLRRPDDGAVCLLRRRNTGFLDGYYALPGGHLQAGEQVQAAATRELAEESGVRSDKLRPLACLPYRTVEAKAAAENGSDAIATQQGINFVFEADIDGQTPIINEPDLADDLLWWLPGTKPPRMPAWVRTVAQMSPDDSWYQEFDWPPSSS